jgi:hypothetical protein
VAGGKAIPDYSRGLCQAPPLPGRAGHLQDQNKRAHVYCDVGINFDWPKIHFLIWLAISGIQTIQQDVKSKRMGNKTTGL